MKIIKLFSIFVITVLFAICGGNYYFQSRLPQISGELKLKGLKSPVTIYRDKFSIPHIQAENRLDAMRALGFTVAGDRLFHMDFLRRVANGQLSEVLGPKAKKWDVILRKLRIRQTMNDYVRINKKDFSPQMLAEVKAYFAGVLMGTRH